MLGTNHVRCPLFIFGGCATQGKPCFVNTMLVAHMQELRQRIRDSYEARWKAEKHFDEDQILNEMPGSLRIEVSHCSLPAFCNLHPGLGQGCTLQCIRIAISQCNSLQVAIGNLLLVKVPFCNATLCSCAFNSHKLCQCLLSTGKWPGESEIHHIFQFAHAAARQTIPDFISILCHLANDQQRLSWGQSFNLFMQVCMHTCADLIASVPFLEDAEDDFVRYLVTQLHPTVWEVCHCYSISTLCSAVQHL